MKKYWKIITIVVLTIVSVGTFYVQSAIAANKLPRFSIEKISGDEKEIESLMMSGLYQDKDRALYEYLDLTLDGSLYGKQQSFFERISESHYPTLELASLVNEYRSFMRGKGWSIDISEDDQSIVHVDTIHKYNNGISTTFAISKLDKKNNKKTAFNHELKMTDFNGWIDVMKVQVQGDELNVITKNENYEDGHEKWDVYMYTFDLTNNSLINEEMVFSINDEQSTEGRDHSLSVYALEETSIENANDTLAFIKNDATLILDSDGLILDESVERALLIYDLITGELIEMKDEEFKDYGEPEFYDDQMIYFTDVDEGNKIAIHKYDLSKKKWVDTLTIDQAKDSQGMFITMENDKIILVNPYKDIKTPAFITVVDLKTEELLYQGEIKNEDMTDSFELDIHSFGFR